MTEEKTKPAKKAKRIGISPKTRFEVFKRDKFTCQYCGAKAPDVVLHADHIKPVAEGGGNDLMNLVTSCAGCNGGKGARLISDQSVVERQRQQIAELEERRQQLEMMLQWRDELSKLSANVEGVVADHIAGISGYRPNENGMRDVKKWAKRFNLDLLLNAIDEAYGKYAVWRDGKMTSESWNIAFGKVVAFANSKMKYGEGPEVQQLVYIQAIVRNRIGDKWFKCLSELKELHDAGYDAEVMKKVARRLDHESEFYDWHRQWLEATRPK